jgi:chromosome segregation ATPase
LLEENQKLDGFLDSNKRDLEDAMYHMNKATEDIKKLKLLQEQSDSQLDQYRKEIEILKSKLETKSEQFVQTNQPNQDSKIIGMVEAQIKEYNVRMLLF